MTAPHECEQLERVHAFADGELSGTDADELRDHLATCAACQAELAELLQLDAAVTAMAAGIAVTGAASGADAAAASGADALAASLAAPVPPVISLAWYRQRRVQLAAVAFAAAASVAIYVALPGAGTPVGPVPVAIALAPRRVVEARLAWREAAAYRAYDVPRAGEAPHEAIALQALADLAQRGDDHGVGVLALLNGDRGQAAAHLARAGDSADVLSDRAALALADHLPARALALADAALGRDAGHAAARWNRALALRDLGLSRAAAAAFREVATRGEPGWADEAGRRAAALDTETDAVQRRFARVNQAGVAFARGAIELAADDARAMPGFARGILYDAIRAAATPAQLAALAPLAEAIDTADRDTAITDALARARAALHPELSSRYAALVRALAVEGQIAPAAGDEAPVPAGAARTQLLAALRAAHADDLLIGALMKLAGDRRVVDRGELAEFARLTAASPDPWIQLLGLQHQATVALAQGDLAGAEPILVRGRQRCTAPGAPAFRCLSIEALLGRLHAASRRLPEARATLAAAWQAARASGEWIVQDALLEQLAEAASLGDDPDAAGPALARAYRDELALRRGATGPLRYPNL
jgi:cellulose synthase operon protein C